MEEDQLIKTLEEAEQHILKARNLLYNIFKDIEKREKDAKKKE